MRLGVLFSGGKDSCLALQKAMKKNEVMCLITVVSENPESFMFHTPNIHLTELQAFVIGLPLLSVKTKGEKEKELEELEEAVRGAKEIYEIEGVVTGAIESFYQKTRVERICKELGLECVNPLWQRNQIEILKELVELGYDVMITGVFAEPFGKDWLGRKIDKKTVEELKELEKKYKINPSGEGGELETTVLDAPFFNKKISVENFSIKFSGCSGTMNIEKTKLVEK